MATPSTGRMSLLDIVQNILSAMDSDEVNSISDTVESLQVAEVVRETYFELLANYENSEYKTLVSLEGLSDATYPNQLKVPDNVSELQDLWYDTLDSSGVYRKVKLYYISPEDYLDKTTTMVAEGAVSTEEENPDYDNVKW